MISIFKYQTHEYFKEREDHYFLFETISPIMKVAKLIKYKGSYYFDYTGMQIKAITTPSISLKDLSGTPVHYRDYPIIKGIAGEFGVANTPYIYIFWTHIPMKDDNGNPLGCPCALPDNYDIIFKPFH
jgi:hypothetical protein